MLFSQNRLLFEKITISVQPPRFDLLLLPTIDAKLLPTTDISNKNLPCDKNLTFSPKAEP